jgi:hypothetical protein
VAKNVSGLRVGSGSLDSAVSRGGWGGTIFLGFGAGGVSAGICEAVIVGAEAPPGEGAAPAVGAGEALGVGMNGFTSPSDVVAGTGAIAGAVFGETDGVAGAADTAGLARFCAEAVESGTESPISAPANRTRHTMQTSNPRWRSFRPFDLRLTSPLMVTNFVPRLS